MNKSLILLSKMLLGYTALYIQIVKQTDSNKYSVAFNIAIIEKSEEKF